MKEDTIPGREGGQLSLPDPADAVGFPQLPRSRKVGTTEAILSVASRLKRVEDMLDLEDDDGEEA